MEMTATVVWIAYIENKIHVIYFFPSGHGPDFPISDHGYSNACVSVFP